MPRKISRIRSKDTASDGDETPNDDDIQNEVYGVVVVFKKRGRRPAKCTAIYLANIPEMTDGCTTFRPSCKIVHGWSPSQKKDLHEADFEDMTDIDAKDNVFVAAQKFPCPSKNSTEGLEPRFLSLVQVVFDKAAMMDEVSLSSSGGMRAAEGILQYFGVEDSDEETGRIDIV